MGKVPVTSVARHNRSRSQGDCEGENWARLRPSQAKGHASGGVCRHTRSKSKSQSQAATEKETTSEKKGFTKIIGVIEPRKSSAGGKR